MKRSKLRLPGVIILLVLIIISPIAGENNTAKKKAAVITRPVLVLNRERALALAIKNSIDLKVIKTQEKVYDLTIWERYREYFPTFGVSYTRMEERRTREIDSRTHTLSFDSEVVIYDGGKRGLSFDIARLQSILARNDYRIALNKIILEINSAYLQLLQLKDSIEIHEMTLTQGKRQLKFITKEYELGDATKLSLMEIEAKVKEIELNLEQAKDQLTIAFNQFKLMLKIHWRQNIIVSGSIEKDLALYPPMQDFDLEKYIGLAIKRRKEIESSNVSLTMSRKSYKLSKLYYFPKFSVGLNYSLSDDQFMPHQKSWGINFKVATNLYGNSSSLNSSYGKKDNGNALSVSNSGTLKVLDSMGYKRNIVENEIKLAKARDEYKTIREQISTEILTTYSSLVNTWKMLGIAQKQTELYDSQLKIERLKANLGESRRYDLIEKEIERGEAAISYLQTKVKYLLAASSLEMSMGVDIGYLKLSKLKQ